MYTKKRVFNKRSAADTADKLGMTEAELYESMTHDMSAYNAGIFQEIGTQYQNKFLRWCADVPEVYNYYFTLKN